MNVFLNQAIEAAYTSLSLGSDEGSTRRTMAHCSR